MSNRPPGPHLPAFGSHGPFDPEEQAVILEVVRAVPADQFPELLAAVATQVERLEELGALINRYPSLLGEQRLAGRCRNLDSLVERLGGSGLSRFDMYVPTRAQLGRSLVMAEVNFYRLLRLVCREALPVEASEACLARVDARLCQCLYVRLAEEVLRHIASDRKLSHHEWRPAVLALVQIWDRNTYRLQDVFPVLQATWDARRRVPATLGTLMGTSEMFGLIREGADPAFVEALTDAEQTPEMASAFREFLFGASTETLRQLEEGISSGAHTVIDRSQLAADLLNDACGPGDDPATAMFAFFLARHGQAAARRLIEAPGPKRSAEEYVLLRHLQLTSTASS